MLPEDHFKIVTKSADNLAAGESHLPPGPERRRQRRNKTKYFRLRLYYEVGKRAYRDLIQTSERQVKIQCSRQNGHTDIVTP